MEDHLAAIELCLVVPMLLLLLVNSSGLGAVSFQWTGGRKGKDDDDDGDEEEERTLLSAHWHTVSTLVHIADFDLNDYFGDDDDDNDCDT